MRKLLEITISVIIGGSVVIYAGWICKQASTQAAIPAKRVQIHSPRQFQALLNELEPEYPIAEDGIIGRESIEKWERVYCNQQAMKTFEKANNK